SLRVAKVVLGLIYKARIPDERLDTRCQPRSCEGGGGNERLFSQPQLAQCGGTATVRLGPGGTAQDADQRSRSLCSKMVRARRPPDGSAKGSLLRDFRE